MLSVLPVNLLFLSDQVSDQVSAQENAKVSVQEINQESAQLSNQESDQVHDQVSDQVHDQVSDQVNKTDDDLISKHVTDILLYAITAKSRKDILAYLGLKNHFDNFKRHIAPLIEKGWLYMTIPQEPNHPKQKYITTPHGKEKLEKATR